MNDFLIQSQMHAVVQFSREQKKRKIWIKYYRVKRCMKGFHARIIRRCVGATFYRRFSIAASLSLIEDVNNPVFPNVNLIFSLELYFYSLFLFFFLIFFPLSIYLFINKLARDSMYLTFFFNRRKRQ